MSKEYLANPLNRRKKRYKYYLRLIENFLKLFFVYIFIFPLTLPILLFNFFSKNKFVFKDCLNQHAIVFIVFVLQQKKKTVFLINISDYHKALNRFGLLFFLKNFSINLSFNNSKSISFTDPNADYYFNQDYFLYFDRQGSQSENQFILPFYLTRNIYIKNKLKKYQNFSEAKKKFKIIFSGTVHNEWYEDFYFKNNKNEHFLNRHTILNFVKQNFKENILVLNNESQLNEIENTNKQILIMETNPDISGRNKNFSEFNHFNLISQSNFFLCLPGASMPLCYHLIESCLVGTVPILSYNDYLMPKFNDKEALFFFNKAELLTAINKALKIDEIEYLNMKKNIIRYYNDNLSPSGVYKKLINKKFPIEIFTNFDHISSKLRIKRLKN